MTAYTQYRDPTDTRRTPSPFIWADCPTLQMEHDPAAGHHFFDDFYHWELDAGGNSALRYAKYYIDSDTGVILAPDDDTDFGVIETTVQDTAQDAVVLVYGVEAGFARFGTGAFDQVWFEARFSIDTITDNENTMFLGFIETTVDPTASDTLVDTTGVPDTSEDFVGFWLDGDTAGEVLECIYQEGSATRVNPGNAITTLVAGTFYKVGMRYKRTGATTGKLDYIVNGAIVQTVDVTSSLSFPDVNHLSPIWANKDIDGGSNIVKLDWWRVAAVGGNI